MTPWTLQILITAAIYAFCKALMFHRSLGYLLLWPGMDPAPFGQIRPPLLSADKSGGRICLWGLARMAAGALLLAWAGHPVAVLAGFFLLVHFGLCDVLCGLWRRGGVPVERLFVHPWASRTLGEFWGRRWNLAFHAVTKRRVFAPVARRWGAGWGVAAAFLWSGLLHDLLLSVPAGGGYGLPTLYFALQGLGVRWKVSGRFATLAWVLGPAPLLFHGPFIDALIRPLTS